MLDATPRAEVINEVAKIFGECGLKVAVVQRPGPKWKDTLMMTNETKRPECQKKETCLICNTDKG